MVKKWVPLDNSCPKYATWLALTQPNQCCILICRFIQKESQQHKDKRQVKSSLTKYTSHFICNVCVWGFTVRGSLRPNRTAIFWPPLLWPSALCLSCSPGLLNQRPRGPLCWLSLLHLISNFSGPQLIRGSKGPFGLVWLSLPHLVSYSNSNCLTSVLTELYNSSTPTQSLKWHVWSSSSGNNCHAVHRSLSSGASLWSGTFTLSHIISRAHLHDFLS